MIRTLFLSFFVLALVGCDDDDGSLDAGFDAGALTDSGASDAGPGGDPDAGPAEVVPIDELEITPADPPLTVADGVLFATLPYGPDDRQVFDAFWHPDAASPTAAVIFIHGGGFVAGSRTSAYDGGTGMGLQYLLEQGVAYFTIDYRLLALGSETEGAIKSLRDSRRALQFIRYYASRFNVDAERVALIGSSAGAGTSLWLAFHDEMADPSGDAIDQQSTRVRAAAVVATQATYELFRWPSDVFSPTYPLTVEELLADAGNAAQVVTFYGVDVLLATQPAELQALLETPEYVAYRQELDMLAWMSADDPPFYARNQAADAAPGAPGFDLLHHPLHAATLDARATEVGLEAVVEAPALSLGGDTGMAEFLLSNLAP